tara:strand:- start:289 stop:882 length:594 start_codon:yes stop_codon:yes gene_type:complete
MILLILKNAHSSLEYYDGTQTDLCPDVNWCVWREPWQRFISGIWTDVVGKQKLDKPATKNYSVDELTTKIMDKDWLHKQMEGDGHQSLFYNAGHMMSQWNYLIKECHRRKLSAGMIRIYGRVKTATKIHFDIKAPHKINVSPSDVIERIRDTVLPFKKQIVETYLQQDYEIWEQLDPVLPSYKPFITVPVDKIRKDI